MEKNKDLKEKIDNAEVQLKALKKEEERIIKQLEFYRRFEHQEDMDGIEYAVGSSWEEIDDPIFHKKCKNYRNAATELKEYVWSKIKELESMIGSDP
jgi:restriction endonuclease S subunit